MAILREYRMSCTGNSSNQIKEHHEFSGCDEQNWSGSEVDNRTDYPIAGQNSSEKVVLIKVRIYHDRENAVASLRSQIVFSPFNPKDINKSDKERKALRFTARSSSVCFKLKKQGLKEDM
jgi:hypothetical protein